MRVKIKTKMPWELALRVLLAYLNQNPHRNFDDFMTELLKRGIKLYENEKKNQK